MSDPNKEQPAINTRRNKSIQAVQATKSDQASDPLDSTTSVTRRKRRHFVELIALISLGAIAFIIFVSRPAIAQPYEGLGIALCAVACGVLLVRHAFRVLTEQDKLEEEQVNADQATVSPSQPNSAGLQTNPIAPSPHAGQKIKDRIP
jgi:F0F1-type ATP synthase assembly protein I